MALTHGTTVGGNPLPRIYDRLRKRSQRLEVKVGLVDSPVRLRDFWDGYDHLAYVAGVKDALNAVSVNPLIATFKADSAVGEFING